MHPSHPVRWLADEELPLPRLYACEREWNSRLFLTQPAPTGLHHWMWAQAESIRFCGCRDPLTLGTVNELDFMIFPMFMGES